MKDESIVQQEIQIKAMNYKCHLLRNNSGALKDETGRLVRYGLGNVSQEHQARISSSDLIGFTKITITPKMVGKTIAVFTAIEAKREDWKINKKLNEHETAQNNFLNFIKNNGGIASFCNSADQLKDIIVWR